MDATGYSTAAQIIDARIAEMEAKSQQASPPSKVRPSFPFGGPRFVVDEKAKLEQGATRVPRSYYATHYPTLG